MTTKISPISKYVQVDVSAARMARIWSSVNGRLTSPPLYRRRPVLAMVAGVGVSLGVAAGYGWFSWRTPTNASRSATVLQTATDQLTVELGKGITLRLAAHSRVQLPPGSDERILVRLQHGAITCDLESRDTRRFSVLVEDLEVRDTGTRFSVSHNAETGQIEVSVDRGSVEVVGAAGLLPAKSLSAGERWVRDGRSRQSSVAGGPGTPAPSVSASGSPLTAPPAIALPSGMSEATPRASALESSELPNSQALLEQASAARRAGKPELASRALQKLIHRYPNDTRVGLAALELGRLRMGPLSDIPGAVRALQTALTRAPNASVHEDALAHLIEAHAMLGDRTRCRALRQKYLGEYPNGIHRALVEQKCGDP